MPYQFDVLLCERQRFSCCYSELPFNQILTRDHFCNRMLNLKQHKLSNFVAPEEGLPEESDMFIISIWRAQWRQSLVSISQKTSHTLYEFSALRISIKSGKRGPKIDYTIASATFPCNFTLRCQILWTVLEWFVTAPVNSSIHVLHEKYLCKTFLLKPTLCNHEKIVRWWNVGCIH